ncbi:MAG: acyl-CoA dehydratase activase [Lachnospiraceae bacterium]|nr:acyl-CoA dehydratase activase [Lachnospiraceae bacterium]
MNFIGIDIGSTCAKTAIMDESQTITDTFVIPTGWSSFDAIRQIQEKLTRLGIDPKQMKCVSTGYGREAVSFADKKVTEITCHAKGGAVLFGAEKINLIDIGGQDTKVISCTNGRVEEFFMNDKCSAGTGKFVEIMANRLLLPIEQLDEVARQKTEELTISSMCTVFAESEIVALIGKGTSKENISWGVLNSVVRKVKQEYSKLHDDDRPVYLTGGLCDNPYFLELLSKSMNRTITSCPRARYAGAIGAAAAARQMAGF